MHFRLHHRNLFGAAVLAPLALAVFTNAACASTTLPPRKPGLWQTTMTMEMTMNGQPVPMGGAPHVTAMCSDAATDANMMKKMAGDTGNCAKFNVEVTGDTYTMDGSCAAPFPGGGAMTMHSVVVKQNDDAYHVVSQTTSSHMSSNLVGDSKWIGACPAGVIPGDVGTMQNGQFMKQMNVLQAPPGARPPQQ